MKKKLPVLFLVGPTASGKTRLSIALARKLHGEIISADSMMVYRGMDIGTAKPTLAERKRIPHHLIDCLPIQKNFSVFEFRELAIKKIRAVIRRGALPMVVGGTGLYVRSLLRGLSELPGPNLELRSSLEWEAREKGLAVLYERLSSQDPVRASQIKSTDQKRIIRALEVIVASASPESKKLASFPGVSELGFFPVVVGITKDRSALYADIEKRVDQMFRRGLVREARSLMGKKISLTARQAVGYKEVFSALAGEITMDRAKELIKRNTRRLAKRQMTWFRKEEGLRWVLIETGEKTDQTLQRIVRLIETIYSGDWNWGIRARKPS